MTKGLRQPPDAPVADVGTDPALIAARDMKALDDEFDAMMATTQYRDDERAVLKSKKWLGALKKSTRALDLFADATPTTPAGLLEKLRYVEGQMSVLYKDNNEFIRHLRSAIAYVDTLAPGAARILAD